MKDPIEKAFDSYKKSLTENPRAYATIKGNLYLILRSFMGNRWIINNRTTIDERIAAIDREIQGKSENTNNE